MAVESVLVGSFIPNAAGIPKDLTVSPVERAQQVEAVADQRTAVVAPPEKESGGGTGRSEAGVSDDDSGGSADQAVVDIEV